MKKRSPSFQQIYKNTCMKNKDFEELPEWMIKSGSYTFEEAIKKTIFVMRV